MTRKILLLLTLSYLSLGIQAETITNSKRDLINEMLEVTGAKNLTTLMTNALSQKILRALSEKYGKLDPEMENVIRQEAKVVMYEEFTLNNQMNDIMFALYDEYFSEEEIKELVKFYSSDVGKRAMSVMPHISRRSMESAKEQANQLGPKLQKRILERLDHVDEALKNLSKDSNKEATEKANKPEASAAASEFY